MPSGRAPLAVAGAATALLSLAAAYLWLLGGPTPPPPTIGGPFTLTDSHGRIVTERDFHGRFMLIYFGYTACRDVCPATLTDLAAALDRLGPRADRLQPVFITLDPARDTAETLRRYTASFTPRLIGLTGSPAELARVAHAFHIHSEPHTKAGHAAIDHSSVLLLIDPEGHFLAPIRADESAPEMATDLARYLS